MTTRSSIKAFVAKFLAGQLKQHLMSDEIPEDWEATTGVKVLVCKNFHEVAMNAEKNGLVNAEKNGLVGF